MTFTDLAPATAGKALEVIESLCGGRFDEADARYRALCDQDERGRELLLLPVLIAIQRGQALDALRLVDSFPPGHGPQLRALCLRVLDDPSWHGEALALADSPDPTIARAMRQLLAMPLPGPSAA